MGQKPKCPYCLVELENPPKRKQKCPHCNGVICVRKGQLVTEDEAHITDELFRLESSGLNITRKDFDRARNILTEQSGITASVNDTFWRIFNEWLGKSIAPTSSSMLYYQMAALVSKEKKDWRPYMRKAMTIHLNELKKQGVKTVRVYNGCNDSNSCPGCKALFGKQFSIDAALKEMPIPTLCEKEYPCRCNYVSEEERGKRPLFQSP